MEIRKLHRWDLTPKEAIALQEELRLCVIERSEIGRVRTVAGADIAVDVSRGEGIAAVIVFDYPGLKELARATAKARIKYPYIPGLLSFREGPVLIGAFEKLKILPDVVLFDAQGIAHPRGLGLASHMGLWLDLPAIGCAKSRLVGKHRMPGEDVGDVAPLVVDGARVAGAVLRTRRGVKPIYVSVGHKIDLKGAVEIVLGCLDRTRIPKPTREADRLVGHMRRG